MHPSLLSCLMGTFICMGTTIQEVDGNWVQGTYIHRVLVFDGYLYSRVYGNV